MRVVLFATSAKPVPEVLIVLVATSWFFLSDATLLAVRRIQAQCAWCRLRQARGATVTDKVALVEELDKCVLAVA